MSTSFSKSVCGKKEADKAILKLDMHEEFDLDNAKT